MGGSLFARISPDELQRLYDLWNNDPLSVDPLWSAYFEGYSLAESQPSLSPKTTKDHPSAESGLIPQESSDWHGLVTRLVDYYRSSGHQFARFNPLTPTNDFPAPDWKSFGFNDSELERQVNILAFKNGNPATLGTIISWFETCYCGAIGFEYSHIADREMRLWIEQRIEDLPDESPLPNAECRHALSLLAQSRLLEEFLGKKFPGEKRFSLEGGEGFIVLTEALLSSAALHGVIHTEMGMAHRGRINTLANILNKPLSEIFAEFDSTYMPSLTTGQNDVKYHKGYESIRTFGGRVMTLHLSSNPSHLEAVDPIVEGRTRAIQHERRDKERKLSLPLLIHGDAAFAGQGLVCEVLNMSRLGGFRTGGTIHIIINNQIGFTTLPDESRSSTYATDVAKTIQAPILHINGEDPAALVRAAKLAIEFRNTFGCDIVLDMYCYRRQGHNETDQAAFTNPILSEKIRLRQPVADIYAQTLIDQGTIKPEEWASMQERIWNSMESALAIATSGASQMEADLASSSGKRLLPYSHDPVDTGIDEKLIRQIGKTLTSLPESFHLHPTLDKRFMQRRREAFGEATPFDWGMAEALAWGALLTEGTPVRLTGQDCQRGTFSHRHAVLHDSINGEIFIPLEHVPNGKADFRIFNSALSEASALGFEYGYSIASPQSLVMWEAQFGDFANGAQVIIDQFISSAESKWNTNSCITLLLPHGYEGAGSEHSSGRIERYLQLCADRNMQVLNLTTPAQYFHALRRQIRQGCPKPLILFTPKSLLSHAEAISPWSDFLPGTCFRSILPDPESPSPEQATRAIFCSGKIYYELMKYRRDEGIRDTSIIRIEQIYPLDEDQLSHLLAPYRNIRDFCWCQEEPENMGAWNHLRPRLGKNFAASFRYAGRPMMACPAEGAKTLYLAAQQRLIRAAFGVRTPNEQTRP